MTVGSLAELVTAGKKNLHPPVDPETREVYNSVMEQTFSFMDVVRAVGCNEHSLREWTRVDGKQAYYVPEVPAAGQGTRRRFSFRDVYLARLIFVLQRLSMKPGFIKNVIEAVEHGRGRSFLKSNPAINFLQSSYAQPEGMDMTLELSVSELSETRAYLAIYLRDKSRRANEGVTFKASTYLFFVIEDGELKSQFDRAEHFLLNPTEWEGKVQISLGGINAYIQSRLPVG